MVILPVGEHLGGVHTVQVVPGNDLELPLGGAVQWDPVGEQVPFRDVVEEADEFPRLVVDGVVSFLERVKFLQHLDGDGHVMLLEASDGRVVVQDHGGIQHEDLPFVLLHTIKERCDPKLPVSPSCHPSACSHLSTIDRVPDPHVQQALSQHGISCRNDPMRGFDGLPPPSAMGARQGPWKIFRWLHRIARNGVAGTLELDRLVRHVQEPDHRARPWSRAQHVNARSCRQVEGDTPLAEPFDRPDRYRTAAEVHDHHG